MKYPFCDYLLSSITCLIFQGGVAAQAPDWLWAKAINSIGENQVESMVSDPESGDVYQAGSLYGTADFDPGQDTFYVSANGGFVSRFDDSGHLIWAIGFDGILTRAIELDPLSGAVYFTGEFYGIVDFDPGVDTFYLNSVNSGIYICKLDENGNFIWAQAMGGPGQDQAFSIAIDPFDGDICITGWFSGTADFDPGPGTYYLTSVSSPGYLDIFIARLDNTGNFVWAKAMGGTDSEVGKSIAIDPSSRHVCITGWFGGNVDFDPGSANYSITSAGQTDIFVAKLDYNGNFIWARSLGGEDYDWGMDIAVDPLGRGDVYTTGYYYGTADFDPGSGVYNLTPQGIDMFVSKLDVDGNFIWARSMGGTCLTYSHSIYIDQINGDVITTGSFWCTADFDPGSEAYNLTSAGESDLFVSRLDMDGHFQWAKSAGGIRYDQGIDVVQNVANEVYIAGNFTSTEINFGPDTLINSDTILYEDDYGNFYLSNEIFLAKLNRCHTIVTNTNDHGDGSLRDIISCSSAGGNVTFALPPMSQITLTSGEIIIDKDLNISGPVQSDLTISGNNQSRIFNLFAGNSLALTSLTLKNAFNTINGGAIYVKGNLTLNNVLLQQNFEGGIPKSLTLASPGSIMIIGNVEMKQ